MHFKISQEAIHGIVNFVSENLLCKHGLPIIQALNGLEKIAEEVLTDDKSDKKGKK